MPGRRSVEVKSARWLAYVYVWCWYAQPRKRFVRLSGQNRCQPRCARIVWFGAALCGCGWLVDDIFPGRDASSADALPTRGRRDAPQYGRWGGPAGAHQAAEPCSTRGCRCRGDRCDGVRLCDRRLYGYGIANRLSRWRSQVPRLSKRIAPARTPESRASPGTRELGRLGGSGSPAIVTAVLAGAAGGPRHLLGRAGQTDRPVDGVLQDTHA
jgi:hypothetical protein